MARRETRPAPRALQQLCEAAAGIAPAPAPSAAEGAPGRSGGAAATGGAAAAGGAAGKAGAGAAAGRCRVAPWVEVEQAPWGMQAYASGCLLRLRAAAAAGDGDCLAADKAEGTRHVFAAAEARWRDVPLQLAACAVLALDVDGAPPRTARLAQLCVNAEARGAGWEAEVLEAAGAAAVREGQARLEVRAAAAAGAEAAEAPGAEGGAGAVADALRAGGYAPMPDAPGWFAKELGGESGAAARAAPRPARAAEEEAAAAPAEEPADGNEAPRMASSEDIERLRRMAGAMEEAPVEEAMEEAAEEEAAPLSLEEVMARARAARAREEAEGGLKDAPAAEEPAAGEPAAEEPAEEPEPEDEADEAPRLASDEDIERLRRMFGGE